MSLKVNKMPGILYTTVRGQRSVDPDEAQLRFALFEQPWTEWWKSANNSATLQVILDEDEQGDYSIEGHLPTNTFYRISAQHPYLAIFQPEPDDFFVICFENGQEFYHCSGDSFEDFVVVHSGGEQHRIPRACLVGPETALQILIDFMQTFSRSTVVDWRPQDELPVSEDFWGAV